MYRPADWTPLADSDPIPGDPVAINRLAQRYADTAEAIKLAADKLRSLAAAEGYVGKHADALREKADKVAGDISKAHDRYSRTAAALRPFVAQLEISQATSLRALEAGRRAADDQRVAQRGLDATSDPASPDHDQHPAHQAAMESALAASRAAASLLAGAVADWQRAGDAAADAVDGAAHDTLRDEHHWWDAVASVLHELSKIAGDIAAIAGVLSLLVGWIPVVGQALAAVLGAVALVASAIALVCDVVVNLVALCEGKDVDWLSLGLDVLGVVSFGVGRVLSKGGRTLGRASRAAAWENAFANGAGRAARVEAIGGTLKLGKGGTKAALALGRDTSLAGAGKGVGRESLEVLKDGREGASEVLRNRTAALEALREGGLSKAGKGLSHVYREEGLQGLVNRGLGDTNWEDVARLRKIDPDVYTGDAAKFGQKAFNYNRGMIGATTAGNLAAVAVSYRNHHEVEAEYRLRNVAVADR